VGHHGGHGMMAAAMLVHRVFMIYGMFVVFCACVVRKNTSTW